ncbi:type IV pilus twitching motility protein PilT [Aciduricibacillus chroicocephali]|uniref:Type IV pilus twitching motility protein PilT n=1 Tax=Aciduricibacillus chroicocephali TaxID=3054939 RepID=A0ABY9KTJ1_9BACI|nr:type IV pilus twitching motility protein PilT [Bacillaceae bacterium 44XB]
MHDIDTLLRKAAEMGASDVHLTVGSTPVFRMDGKLSLIGDELLTEEDTIEMARHLLPQNEFRTFEEVGEVDASYHLQGAARYRLSIFRQKQNTTIVARIIPSHIPSIEDLKMPKVLEKIAMSPQGLFLVTGPTGSGKSTTLAAMIDFINKNTSKHIITLEDPIEYTHSHKKSLVHQREIGFDTDSFANALRASLRQDPDIILVGEMRDLETISTAITAAETGHLVLATLHTNSAPQTIHRIIDVFPPGQQEQIRIQLADVLAGVLSQRLFPKKDGAGRVAATELLIRNPSVANLIRNGKVSQITNVMQTSRALGMHTMQMSIQELLQKSLVDLKLVEPYMARTGDN